MVVHSQNKKYPDAKIALLFTSSTISLLENLFFKHLMDLKESLGLKELSLGMFGDFKVAIKYKSTFVRIGSAIFGNRN